MNSSPSKIHTWIIVLLFWIIALLVFGIGYMVYQNQSDDTVDVTTGGAEASCNEAVADALAAKVCDVPAQEKATFTDSFMPLTFQYFKGWHIYSYTNGGTGATTVNVSENPLSGCSECSGYTTPHGSINIASRKLTTGETGKTVFAKKIADLTADTNITITSQSESATGGAVAWADNTPCDGVGCASGKYETWYSSTEKYLFVAGLEADGSAERSAAWTLFVSTATAQ